jgi:hypothetical protein
MDADGLEVFSNLVPLARRNEFLSRVMGIGGVSANDVWASPFGASIFFGSSGWELFRHVVRNQRRFVVESPVINLLRGANAANQSFQRTVPSGTTLFRAQGHQHTEQTTPLTKERLKAPPPELATAGRANASGISVLYVAETVETAVAEVRPFTGGFISVGTCRALQDIRVFDLSGRLELLGRDPFAPGFLKELEIAILASKLDEAFAEPIAPFTSERDYAPTQFVAELLANEGYGGIRYRSALSPGGFNYVFFAPSMFEIDYSHSVQVTGVEVSFKPHVFYSLSAALQQLTEPEELETADPPD